MSTIVIGGLDQNSAYLSSVEVLDDGNSQWTAGPELPFGIYSPALVQDPIGGVILIGGHSKFENMLSHLFDRFGINSNETRRA